MIFFLIESSKFQTFPQFKKPKSLKHTHPTLPNPVPRTPCHGGPAIVGTAPPPWEATTVSPGSGRTGEGGKRDRTTGERRRADAPRRRRLRQP
ncbi:hypothetical protein HanIR_Chr05g0240631 [Helianthus annuus]|nr:hypothetical protein HanIR_Chr05g0240631 [Helianthus annuus]